MGSYTGLLFLLCLSVCLISHAEGSWWWCIIVNRDAYGYSWNGCADNEMLDQYLRMRNYNCLNCDKYFHCMANYNAVHSCSSSYRRETAEMISDCRDDPNCTDPDCRADRVANNYGRNGGDCAARYLCNYNCKFNPDDGTCRRSNC